MLEGEVVLVTDAGEAVLGAGMVAGFPAGRPDGHHFVDRSDRDALSLEIGTCSASGWSTPTSTCSGTAHAATCTRPAGPGSGRLPRGLGAC